MNILVCGGESELLHACVCLPIQTYGGNKQSKNRIDTKKKINKQTMSWVYILLLTVAYVFPSLRIHTYFRGEEGNKKKNNRYTVSL